MFILLSRIPVRCFVLFVVLLLLSSRFFLTLHTPCRLVLLPNGVQTGGLSPFLGIGLSQASAADHTVWT